MKTRHSPTCKMVFGRKDQSCPRCAEMLAGAPARAGWNDAKNRADASRSDAIAKFFATGGEYSRMTEMQKQCCTAFEW